MCLTDVGTIQTLSDSEKAALVDRHNQLRNQVNPQARDMQTMYWDDELAAIAGKWAAQCKGGHDPSSNRSANSLPGITIGQSVAFRIVDVAAINAWYDEVNNFRYSIGSFNGREILHFTQIVWSTTVRVGCGKSNCLTATGGFYFVCNYAVGQGSGPPGAPSLTRPYCSGANCKTCAAIYRDGNMCDCNGKVCFNGGTFDIATCSCGCYDLYTGDQCETKKCPATNSDPSYCTEPGRANFCTQYSNWPYNQCPFFCTTCREKCKKNLDVIFVLDGSQTSANWQQIKSAVSDFVKIIKATAATSRFGVVAYSNTVSANKIELTASPNVAADVESLAYPGNGSATHLAINEAKAMFDRNFLTGKQRIMFLVTDGPSGNFGNTFNAAFAVKNAGIVIYTVGIATTADTAALNNELRQISTSTNHYTLTSYSILSSKATRFLAYICDDSVDGRWNDWTTTSVGRCSVSCGTGLKVLSQVRSCSNPAPQNNGDACYGLAKRDIKETCTLAACPLNPVNGEFGKWLTTDTGTCSVTCGIGLIWVFQSRQCDSPPPSNGGQPCAGDTNRNLTLNCNTFTECSVGDVDGQWGFWGSSVPGRCSVSCGGGSRSWTRTRACDNPAPQNNGRFCVGSSTLSGTETCNTNACPVASVWSAWTRLTVGRCSSLCRRSVSRTRTCNRPTGAPDCIGSSGDSISEVCSGEDCVKTGCPFDVIFVVDESELMRASAYTVNGRIGFQRVNDQIITYLRAVMSTASPGVQRVAYITIGIAATGRQAARQVVALSTDLNAVISAISNVQIQNIALSWSQVAASLPAMVGAGSKVIVITASEVPLSERNTVNSAFRSANADFFAIGLPFQRNLTTAGLLPVALSLGNIEILTSFTDFSIKPVLETFVPIECAILCRRVIDIVIVLDGSFSIGDNVFATSVKTALQGLTTKLFALSTDVSMGLVLFSHGLDANISMTTDISAYRSGIVGLPYPAGGTWTWLGIKAGAQMIYQLNRQASSTRLMIVITDGESANPPLTAEEARLAKLNGIVIYAIGVGQSTVTEMMSIASSPDKVMRVANFDDLANQLLNISVNCPIDGQWGLWGARVDGACSVSCGSGTRPWTRRRVCDSPRPENNGNDCVGSAVETGSNPCTQVACPICRRVIDIVIVLDGSFSIGDNVFATSVKTALQGLTTKLFALSTKVSMGLVLFSHALDANISMTTDISGYRSGIVGLPYPAGGTWTWLGIKAGAQMIYQLNREASSTKLMIVITDGESANTASTAEEARLAKSNGIVIYAVGVGQSTVTELMAIASSPDKVIRVANFDDLANQLLNISVNCPIDGQWGPWGTRVERDCSVTCGSGSRPWTRRRVCDNPRPENDGNDCVGSAVETGSNPCTEVACPINGQWGDWSARRDGPCSVLCGSGTLSWTRTRNCDSPRPANNGQDCPGTNTLSGTDVCTKDPCPVDGQWSAWSNRVYEDCSLTCGGGQRPWTRERTCDQPAPQFGGKECMGNSMESGTETCADFSCPVNGQWGLWSDFTLGRCSKTCGTGQRTNTRTRRCDNPVPVGGLECFGPNSDSQTENCQIAMCPVDGVWGAWGAFMYGRCSVSCGGGSKHWTRTRACDNPAPQNNGQDCMGNDTLSGTETCGTNPCPVDGQWSAWIDKVYEDCSVSCGGGQQIWTRERTCDNPAPQFDGKQCVGNSMESDTETCSENKCPINGQWGNWGPYNYTQCSVTCGNGTKTYERKRACDNPAVQFEGMDCVGSDTDTGTATCNLGICPTGLCSDAQVIQGVGYRLHPRDCDKFIQCYYNPNGHTTGVIRSCPFGQYWNQDILRCDQACNVDCPLEKCKDDCVSTYSMHGSCRGYWTCVNGKSEAACCPVGFAYVETKGCLVDFTCRDMCPTICTGKVCEAVMTMDFSDPDRLTTAPGVKVTTSNVTVMNGVAMFSGYGLIRTSVSLVEAASGCPVTVRLSYKATTRDRQVLVKSPLCRMAESSSLVITVDGNDVVLEMKNWFGTAMSLRVPTDDFKADEWKQVTFVYDGKFATGRVSGDKVTYIFKTFAPKISIAQCGLDFGTDEKKGGLTGEMDTIGVYQCNPWTPVY
ncbi:uncharacterized protein LOC121373452 [Gigantopelta aegis]|uniref:uncharacterized protein LOC121373452 n=1 Tax=Gigantopelta aegis TaxID=1735272 RepID=UPI001B88CD68|nr:uncharacterized protein LOC121373452 [Gigantopelta aegis]